MILIADYVGNKKILLDLTAVSFGPAERDRGPLPPGYPGVIQIKLYESNKTNSFYTLNLSHDEAIIIGKALIKAGEYVESPPGQSMEFIPK